MNFLLALLLIGQLHHFEFVPIPSPQIAGDSFFITIYAQDADSNNYPYTGPALVFTQPGPQYGQKSVTFNSGVWQGWFIATLADTYSLWCYDYSSPPHTGESNQIVFNTNNPFRLLTILPGENYYPGTGTGKTGIPIPQQAGSYFNINVYLTDRWCNRISSGDDSINCFTSDGFSANTGARLFEGITGISFAFRTAGTHRFFVNDVTNPAIKSDTSTPVSIYPGSYSRLLVLLPGEDHLPGDTTTNTSTTPGKYGVPSDQYVLEDFQIKVYATDSMWNKTAISGNSIQISGSSGFSNPPPDTLANGEVIFSANFSTSGEKFLIARDLNNNFYSYDNFIKVVARANNFDISVNPDTIRPGEISYITVTVYDRNNTPIEGKWVNFSVIGGNGYIIPQYDTVQTNSQGVCQSQFTIRSGYFNELDTILVSADNYAESTTVYVIIPDSSVMEGNIVAYPNPFGKINQPYTRFVYYLEESCNIIYAIYDAFGNRVHYEEIPAGQNGARAGINVLTWNGKNDKQKRVASGVYYVLLKGYTHTNIFLEKRMRVGVIW